MARKNYLSVELENTLPDEKSGECISEKLKEEIKIELEDEDNQETLDKTEYTENFTVKSEPMEELIIKEENFDNKDSIFECESCELNFTTEEKLDDHTFWCKNKYKSDRTNYLNKKFDAEVLEIYKIQQNRESIEQDPIKIENTLEKFEIKEEIIKKDKSEIDDHTFECGSCELAFGSKMQLIGHKSWCRRNKISIETVNQIQNDCPSINSSESTTHGMKKIYTCDVCYKTFSYGHVLNEHKRIHTGECDVCHKHFISLSTKLKHKHLRSEKPHECDVCKKTFTLKSNLKQHKLIHTGQKPFACDVCEKIFSYKHVLKDHKRIHTGEKPYACDVCQKQFISMSSKRKHELIHNGEKPYECDVCKRSFNCKSNMNVHKRIHTGEKAYECEVCNIKFRTKRDFNQHGHVVTIVRP